jgi:hypothetical protein
MLSLQLDSSFHVFSYRYSGGEIGWRSAEADRLKQPQYLKRVSLEGI